MNRCRFDKITEIDHFKQCLEAHFIMTCNCVHLSFFFRAVGDWSVDDVSRWLISLNLREHVSAFATALVDGEWLMSGLTDDVLKDLGVVRPAQQMTLKRQLTRLLSKT